MNRVKIEIGPPHRFEYEGPKADRKVMWDEFLRLIGATKAEHSHNPTSPKNQPTRVAPHHTSPISNGSLGEKHYAEMFNVEKDTLSLKYKPAMESDASKTKQVGYAMLVLLLGYRKFFNTSEVKVSALNQAIEASGLGQFKRIGFAYAPLHEENLIVMNGKAKGAKYKLTNPGVKQAEQVILRTVKDII